MNEVTIKVEWLEEEDIGTGRIFKQPEIDEICVDGIEIYPLMGKPERCRIQTIRRLEEVLWDVLEEGKPIS